ncbi:hypothetical protein Patl1_11724 [Pistacia atlantica]|uniref:Uncharacterized protein n=1 Tax=Pistacia atlantica TaxID=434234 RepID=A0ACC1A2W7_9ROSI|nr:hypothetical protein Patl1_11724 [Pistacia atlantica]
MTMILVELLLLYLIQKNGQLVMRVGFLMDNLIPMLKILALK